MERCGDFSFVTIGEIVASRIVLMAYGLWRYQVVILVYVVGCNMKMRRETNVQNPKVRDANTARPKHGRKSQKKKIGKRSKNPTCFYSSSNSNLKE